MCAAYFAKKPTELHQWELSCAPVRYRQPNELALFEELAKFMAQRRTISFFGATSIQRMFRGASPTSTTRLLDLMRDIDTRTPRGSPQLTSILSTNNESLEDVTIELAELEHVLNPLWSQLVSVIGARTRTKSSSSDTLAHYESMHRMASLYLWLHYRYPTSFPTGTLAWKTKSVLESVMEELLEQRNEAPLAPPPKRRSNKAKCLLLLLLYNAVMYATHTTTITHTSEQ